MSTLHPYEASSSSDLQKKEEGMREVENLPEGTHLTSRTLAPESTLSSLCLGETVCPEGASGHLPPSTVHPTPFPTCSVGAEVT